VIAYIESSAAAKLLVEEAESAALAAYLDHLVEDGSRLVSSALLETELRRFATRIDLDQARVTAVLDRIDLLEIDGSLHRDAGLLPGRFLRSLDAIHIAVARRAHVEVLITYDHRQRAGADSVGLPVASPDE
jgi:predicted nucleic acid-binding protein